MKITDYIFVRFLIGIFFVVPVTAGQNIPEGTFSHGECLTCHQKSTPEIVNAWDSSAHGENYSGKKEAADCTSCHGNEHKGSAKKARKNSACINCHGGPKSPINNSYITSKHGVISTIESPKWDWSRPLADGFYRSPTCAYCHLYAGNHNMSGKIRPWNPLKTDEGKKRETAEARDSIESVCSDCHSPRLITTYFKTGNRMFEIGQMKTREAANVIDDLEKDGLLKVTQVKENREESKIRQVFEKMRTVHMKNLWYGVAHQSPDYQWWHGQPALDEDLLHIKALSTRIKRKEFIKQEKKKLF